MRNYLIVVDMQNDFIDGALGTKEAEAIVDKVAEKIRLFEGEVIFTRDTHEENYLDTQEGARLPVVHCVRGSEGWKIREGLEAIRPAAVIDKPTFGSAELGAMLLQRDLERAAHQGLSAGDADRRRRGMLRGRHAAEPPKRARGHEDVPDHGRKRVKEKGSPRGSPSIFIQK